MSEKYKALTKKTTKNAIAALAIIALAGGVYAAVTMYSGRIEIMKTEYEGKLATDNSLLSSLKSQIETSGESEKRYAALQEIHINPSYEVNRDDLMEWLTNARDRYNFASANFTPAVAVKTDKPELASFNYDIMVYPRMKLDFSAPSDLHVFSFIDEMRRFAAGIVRIDKVQLTRKGDLEDTVIEQMKKGTVAALVEAKIEFTLIGVAKRPDNPAGAPAAAK
jgi:hypothetical protein